MLVCVLVNTCMFMCVFYAVYLDLRYCLYITQLIIISYTPFILKPWGFKSC